MRSDYVFYHPAWQIWGESSSPTVQFEAADLFSNTIGKSLLIIPQCFCRLICMWLISVWRSCLWSAGRNPDSSVLRNLRDVLEIEFPSPATHEKSVCHTVAPSLHDYLKELCACVLCVCINIYECILSVCVSVWALSYKGADVFFWPFPYFSVFCSSKRWAHTFSFNWVVNR